MTMPNGRAMGKEACECLRCCHDLTVPQVNGNESPVVGMWK